MLILYDFGNSVCCQKVRITMRAKGLEWDAIKVDLFKVEQYDAKYLKLKLDYWLSIVHERGNDVGPRPASSAPSTAKQFSTPICH